VTGEPYGLDVWLHARMGRAPGAELGAGPGAGAEAGPGAMANAPPSALPNMDEVRAWQFARLRETVAHARENSPFYRETLAAVAPGTIRGPADLARLPRTTAADLTRAPERFLAVSQDEVARVVTLHTSGTTGPHKRVFYTVDDLVRIEEFFAHGMAALAAPGDPVAILLPGERPDSVGVLLARALARSGKRPLLLGPLEATSEGPGPSDASGSSGSSGAPGVAGPPGNSGADHTPARAVERILAEGARCVVGSPAHCNALAATWAARGLPRDVLRAALLCWDVIPLAVAENLRRAFGCRVFRHWGMVETGLGGAVDCAETSGMHLREADIFVEIAAPATGAPLPDGEWGEITVTTLGRRGMPLVRYRTGDAGRILPGACACGLPLRRLDRVPGRLGTLGGPSGPSGPKTPGGAARANGSDETDGPDAAGTPGGPGAGRAPLDKTGPGSGTLEADATKPDATKPDATKPDATKPDATKPDATKPDATKPDATKPDATKPDAAKPDATRADAPSPGAPGADASGADAPGADAPDQDWPDMAALQERLYALPGLADFSAVLVPARPDDPAQALNPVHPVHSAARTDAPQARDGAWRLRVDVCPAPGADRDTLRAAMEAAVEAALDADGARRAPGPGAIAGATTRDAGVAPLVRLLGHHGPAEPGLAKRRLRREALEKTPPESLPEPATNTEDPS
jgi:hypothetical protein